MMLRHECAYTTSTPVADPGTSESWKIWFFAGVDLLETDMARVLKTLNEWQRRRTCRIRLSNLNDRMLRDIGFTREEALRETRKPFWRA